MTGKKKIQDSALVITEAYAVVAEGFVAESKRIEMHPTNGKAVIRMEHKTESGNFHTWDESYYPMMIFVRQDDAERYLRDFQEVFAKFHTGTTFRVQKISLSLPTIPV